MAKKYLAAIVCLLILVIAFFSGCSKKFEKKGHMKDAGILLTFDDNRVNNWFTYLPLLDSEGVKATFYISCYNKFTSEQKQKLHIIQSHGHEIAFHSTNHYNMVDYVYKQKHTIADLLQKEVEAGLKLMNKDGFYPTTFAYPFGAHNAIIDKALLQHNFKSVRALNGTNDFSKSLIATSKNDVLYGLGIDRSSNRSDVDITNFLQSAKKNNTCAVLVAHDINTNNRYSVTLQRLKNIIAFVKNNNLKYYTASEISN